MTSCAPYQLVRAATRLFQFATHGLKAQLHEISAETLCFADQPIRLQTTRTSYTTAPCSNVLHDVSHPDFRPLAFHGLYEWLAVPRGQLSTLSSSRNVARDTDHFQAKQIIFCFISLTNWFYRYVRKAPAIAPSH